MRSRPTTPLAQQRSCHVWAHSVRMPDGSHMCCCVAPCRRRTAGVYDFGACLREVLGLPDGTALSRLHENRDVEASKLIDKVAYQPQDQPPSRTSTPSLRLPLHRHPDTLPPDFPPPRPSATQPVLFPALLAPRPVKALLSASALLNPAYPVPTDPLHKHRHIPPNRSLPALKAPLPLLPPPSPHSPPHPHSTGKPPPRSSFPQAHACHHTSPSATPHAPR